MDKKIGGVGIKNMVILALFTMLFIVLAKVVFTKYEVKGVSQVVQSV